MATIDTNMHYSLDDVLLRPGFSEIETRQDIDISQEFLGRHLTVPILNSAMDTVSNVSLIKALQQAGGLGVLPRLSYDDLSKAYDSIQGDKPAVSVGVKEDIGQILETLLEVNPRSIFNIDVAHGDHVLVAKRIKEIKGKNSLFQVMAGNVATREGFMYLSDVGADAIKIGIGSGSACTTRITTGHGVPLFSSLMDVIEVRNTHYSHVKVVCDGGIRNSGDIVKVLGVGSDAVMLGKLLAESSEAPGERFNIDGEVWKVYRGQSTVGSNLSSYIPEGVSGLVKIKGPVADIIKQLAGGIRSGLSYSGSRNLSTFSELAEFIVVSHNSLAESNPRLELLTS